MGYEFWGDAIQSTAEVHQQEMVQVGFVPLSWPNFVLYLGRSLPSGSFLVQLGVSIPRRPGPLPRAALAPRAGVRSWLIHLSPL